MAQIGFWRSAAQLPMRTVVVEDDGHLVTAGELLAAANRLVHGLRARGLSRGDAIAVSMKNRTAYLELYFAAAQAGWYFVPLSTRLAPPEFAYVLADSDAKAFVFDAEAAEAARRGVETADYPVHRCFTLDDLPSFAAYQSLQEGQPASLPSDRRAGERMSYTSGTTGRPKAVRRPLEDVTPEERAVASALHLRAAAGIRASDSAVHLVSSPLHHSASLLWCTDHLQLGHAVVLLSPWSPEGALDRIERHGVTTAFMVPTHFHRLLSLDQATRSRYRLSSLRHVVHSGAPCPIEVKRALLEWLGPVVYETYAATEGPGTQVGPQEWLAHPGTVGKAGNAVHVLRPDGSVCAPGEVGTVFLAGGTRRFEYFNAPDKTNAGRRGDLFTVGDVGYVDADGYLFLCDRSDDVIISGGVNIYPSEVESVLMRHPAVNDVAVFGVPDEEWGEQVKAVVQVDPGTSTGEALGAELTAHCREQLAGFKCPRSIEFATSLPRDDAGKLRRRVLRDPYWAGRTRSI